MVLPLLARFVVGSAIRGAASGGGGGGGNVSVKMPQINVSVKDNIADVLKGMDRVARDYVPQAVVRSLNRTITSTNSEAVRKIAQLMGTQQKVVKSRIRIGKASKQYMIASLIPGGRPFRLAHFSPRQTKAGVSAAAWGKRKLYKHTFLATVKAGEGSMQGVFIRKTAKRFPIKQLWGPSVPGTFKQDEVMKLMEQTSEKRFNKEFQQNLNYFITRSRAKN